MESIVFDETIFPKESSETKILHWVKAEAYCAMHMELLDMIRFICCSLNMNRDLQKIVPTNEFDDANDLINHERMKKISNIHEKDKLILEDYFLKKLNPNKIVLLRKWDKYYIYRVVESWKRELMSINAWNSLIKYPQKFRKDKANLKIKKYVKKHKHTHLTIDQIKNHFTSLLPWNGIQVENI